MSIQEIIDQQVKGHTVVLYMKGSPDFPQCGFSAKAVSLLRQSGVQDFSRWTYCKTPRFVRASNPMPTGRPFPNYM